MRAVNIPLLMITPFEEHLILMFRDLGIGSSVTLEATLLRLNTDI
jgi:hypothetical protein